MLFNLLKHVMGLNLPLPAPDFVGLRSFLVCCGNLDKIKESFRVHYSEVDSVALVL